MEGVGKIEAAKPAVIEVKGTFPQPDFSRYVGKRIMAFGLSVDSSIDVCVQLGGVDTNNALDLVDKYIEKLQGARPPLKSLAAGSPCLAFYENDGGWYRARILKQINETTKFRVVLVDYGNVEVVDARNLMEIPIQLVNYVEGASECALTDFDGDDTDEELEFLKLAIVENDLICQIEDTACEVRRRNRVLLTIFAQDAQGKLSPLKKVMKEKLSPKKPTMLYRLPSQPSQDVCDGTRSSCEQPSEAYIAAPRTSSPSLDQRSQNALTNIDNRNNIKATENTTSNISKSTTTSDPDWMKARTKFENIIDRIPPSPGSHVNDLNHIIAGLMGLVKDLSDTFNKEVNMVRLELNITKLELNTAKLELSKKEAEVSMLRTRLANL